MAELEWIEERWWHRLLKVVALFVVIFVLFVAGAVFQPRGDNDLTWTTWDQEPPPDASVTPCLNLHYEGSIAVRCLEGLEDQSLNGFASALLERGVIEETDRLVVLYSPPLEGARYLGRVLQEKRAGLWVQSSSPWKEWAIATARSLGAAVAAGGVLWTLRLFILYIVHGHTRVRPKV